MHRRILQLGGNLGKIQVVLPNHLLALLQLDAADVLAGRDLQILMEECRQVAGADIHLSGNQRHRQLLTDVGGNKLLGLTDILCI